MKKLFSDLFFWIRAKLRPLLNDAQWQELQDFGAGWFDKLSVGCMLVVFFREEKILGAITTLVCVIIAIILRIGGKK